MLPKKLLLHGFHPEPPGLPRIIPHYLTEGDYPWVKRFHEEFLRLEGKSRRQVIAHFASPLSFYVPKRKGDLLFHVLLRMSMGGEEIHRGRGAVAASSIRDSLFVEAARSGEKPDSTEVILRVAAELGVAGHSCLEAAFSDLPLERRLSSMPEGLSTDNLCLRTNLLLAQALVARSARVRIDAEGGSRVIVRQAKLRRLICEASSESRLEISGPLELFGHTLLYGRSLAELVPLVFWCRRFSFEAFCRIGGRDGIFEIDASSPLLPAGEPSEHDSRLEARFAKDFGKLATDWDLIREPEAFESGASLIFPDFKIVHRRDRSIFFYLEIIGYWTPQYLARKSEKLAMAGVRNLILCVDEALGCAESDRKLSVLGSVLKFRRRIPAADVLAFLEGLDSRALARQVRG